MALRFFILPCQELAVFTTLVSAALWLRKRGDYHKRLMLLGTIALIPAATTRPFPDSLLQTLMVFGLAEVMFVVLLVTAVSRPLVAFTDTWLALAKVLVG